MALTLATVAGDAAAAWRRQRAVLLPLAGLFLFLPSFAWLLLIDPPVPAPDATRDERLAMLIAFARANAHWIALRIGVETFGAAAVFVLLLSRAHRDLGDVLRIAIGLFPALVAASLLCWAAIGIGSFAFILPGMYLYGRLALTGAALAAEPGVGIGGAITRSVALTHGHGWQVFAYLALTLLAGIFFGQLLGGVEDAMAKAGAINPVARAVLSALTAGVIATTILARLLMEVSLYRRLVGKV